VCASRFLFNKILRRRYLVEETTYPKTPRRLPIVLTVGGVLYLHLSRRHLQAVANPLEALAIPAPETVYKSRRLHKP
jgi:hypothetical protein